MASRTERVLTEEELGRIAGTFRAWRGVEGAGVGSYEDVPGFCRSVPLGELRKHDFVLTPGRYVGVAEAEVDPDAEPVEERVARLTKELFGLFEESGRLEAVVREQLGRV